MNPVRVYLALLLAAQFIVPLVPSWGAFVPHDHWARARVSPADWSAHIQEHRIGPVADWSAHIQEHRIGPVAATATTTHTGETLITSTFTQNGLTSFQAPVADHNADSPAALAPRVLLHTVLAHAFTARVIAYPPLNPPPTI